VKASADEIAAFEKLALERGGSVGRAPGRQNERTAATDTAHVQLPTNYSEKEFLDDVIAIARRCGWKVAHFRPAKTAKGWRTAVQGDGKGFPDIICLRRGVILVAELKVGKNKETPEQEVWLDEFRHAEDYHGWVKVYVWRPEDWKTIEEVLR